MKLCLIFLTIWLVIFRSQAQPLTNGQVFDFEIGDTLQTCSTQPWNNYKYIYKTDVIVNKVFSNNNNTVSYAVNSSSFAIYYSIMTNSYSAASEYNTYTSVRTISNLGAAAALNNNSSMCIPLKDTTYTNSCGKLVWEKKPITFLTCSTRFYAQNSLLIAGLGGPYYGYSNIDTYPPEGYMSYNLVYYSKASGRCGSLLTGIHETEAASALAVYPNPGNGQFTIQHAGGQTRKIQVTDLHGRLLVEQQIDQTTDIDLRHLQPGMYHLLIGSPGYSLNKKLVIAR